MSIGQISSVQCKDPHITPIFFAALSFKTMTWCKLLYAELRFFKQLHYFWEIMTIYKIWNQRYSKNNDNLNIDHLEILKLSASQVTTHQNKGVLKSIALQHRMMMRRRIRSKIKHLNISRDYLGLCQFLVGRCFSSVHCHIPSFTLLWMVRLLGPTVTPLAPHPRTPKNNQKPDKGFSSSLYKCLQHSFDQFW